MGARLPQGPLVTPQRNSKLLRMSPSASVVSLWLLPLDGFRAASRVPSGHCGFRQAARMEWIKLPAVGEVGVAGGAGRDGRDRADRARAGRDRPPRRCRDRGAVRAGVRRAAVRAGTDWGEEVPPELIYAN